MWRWRWKSIRDWIGDWNTGGPALVYAHVPSLKRCHEHTGTVTWLKKYGGDPRNVAHSALVAYPSSIPWFLFAIVPEFGGYKRSSQGICVDRNRQYWCRDYRHSSVGVGIDEVWSEDAAGANYNKAYRFRVRYMPWFLWPTRWGLLVLESRWPAILQICHNVVLKSGLSDVDDVLVTCST